MYHHVKSKTAISFHKVNYDSWLIDWLANYIEKLQRKTITIKSYEILECIQMIKLMDNRVGIKLNQFEELFQEALILLSIHMKREEKYLFPLVKEMVQAKELNRMICRSALDKVAFLIDLLNIEHTGVIKYLKLISEIMDGYSKNADLPKIVNNLFKRFVEFEQACELHIELQNKYLFPEIILAKYAVG